MAKRKMISQETAIETGQVLAWRLPMLAVSLWSPTPARQAETVRMVAEKQKAFVDGVIDAQAALWRAAMKGTFDLRQVHADVTDAAHAPALKTLKANARRLSKRKTY